MELAQGGIVQRVEGERDWAEPGPDAPEFIVPLAPHHDNRRILRELQDRLDNNEE